ncbi:MerR family transcriptional regulator [Candidatus Berkelbacteria bacterium]|nr:MerR family transcriptional regulator [Candidatus Berkelbacteria bacterium]
MKSNYLSIGRAARYLGLSIATLRRWHKAGTLSATFISPGGRLYYSLANLQQQTKGLTQSALDWASDLDPTEPIPEWHCATSDAFKARLERMNAALQIHPKQHHNAPLITAVTGEIGNNSFDHNLGNWPDIPGALFAYDLGKRTILLADRGVGILATLKRIRPQLVTHQEALKVAFTEIITARAPEHRGNGLKFVRQAMMQMNSNLKFWSGDAFLALTGKDAKLVLSKSPMQIRGCVAEITFR